MTANSRQRQWAALQALTAASIKMYFRNRSAMFFSLFFPIMFIAIFGLLFQNTTSSFKIDVTNRSDTELAQQFETALKKMPGFKVKTVPEEQAAKDLDKNDTDLAVIIPPEFGQTRDGQPVRSAVIARYNEARPQNGQAASQIIQQLTSRFNDRLTGAPQIVTVQAQGVKTKNLTYIDFLLPGMVALSIMQLGIFSVAFGFISYKTTGMLRRLQATPVHPGNFLAAQGITRLIMAVLQTVLLVGIGVWFFGFHLNPASWFAFLVLALLGSVVFMAVGFAIAGWAKNEDQAAPVAQIIQFPMMFLSGTFFPRDTFPPLLQTITDYLPLTYLADALRVVANDGASLWSVRSDVLGLIVWGIIAAYVAIRMFRWE